MENNKQLKENEITPNAVYNSHANGRANDANIFVQKCYFLISACIINMVSLCHSFLDYIFVAFNRLLL